MNKPREKETNKKPDSSGCYTQTMNHGTLHQKPMMQCMVVNTTLKKKTGKITAQCFPLHQ